MNILSKQLIIMLMMLSFGLQATPLKIEIYFLSPGETLVLRELENYLKNKNEQIIALINHQKLTQLDQKILSQCYSMGEGCFHPQLGYLNMPGISLGKINEKPHDDLEGLAFNQRKNQTIDAELPLKSQFFNQKEISLIECQKDYYFDVFCGQQRGDVNQQVDLEVWIDISSSLRQVDFKSNQSECYRQKFIKKIQTQFKGTFHIKTYNTALKSVQDSSDACLNYGTNDARKLLEWMKNSNAKKLLIVTDIDELSPEMQSFIEREAVVMIGSDSKKFLAGDLLDLSW